MPSYFAIELCDKYNCLRSVMGNCWMPCTVTRLLPRRSSNLRPLEHLSILKDQRKRKCKQLYWLHKGDHILNRENERLPNKFSYCYIFNGILITTKVISMQLYQQPNIINCQSRQLSGRALDSLAERCEFKPWNYLTIKTCNYCIPFKVQSEPPFLDTKQNLLHTESQW